MRESLTIGLLTLAVLGAWCWFVREVRRERRRQIIVRFTANTRAMTEAMQRASLAMTEFQQQLERLNVIFRDDSGEQDGTA